MECGQGDPRGIEGQGHGGGPAGKAGGGGGAHPVEALDGGGELLALHALEEELCDVLAALFVLDGERDLDLLLLVLVVDGAEAVVGVHEFVFCLCVLRLDFPDALLLEREGAPAVACW